MGSQLLNGDVPSLHRNTGKQLYAQGKVQTKLYSMHCYLHLLRGYLLWIVGAGMWAELGLSMILWCPLQQLHTAPHCLPHMNKIELDSWMLMWGVLAILEPWRAPFPLCTLWWTEGVGAVGTRILCLGGCGEWRMGFLTLAWQFFSCRWEQAEEHSRSGLGRESIESLSGKLKRKTFLSGKL